MSKTIDEIIGYLDEHLEYDEDAVYISDAAISKAKQAIAEVIEYVIGTQEPQKKSRKTGQDEDSQFYKGYAFGYNSAVIDGTNRLKEVLGDKT